MRDTEDVQTYFEREAPPHAADAWIDAELRQATNRILEMIKDLSA